MLPALLLRLDQMPHREHDEHRWLLLGIVMVALSAAVVTALLLGALLIAVCG